MADEFNQLAYRNSLRSIADDYVIYDLETEEAYTTNGLDLADIARKLGFNSREGDDFATKVYLAEFGSPFEFKGKKFIVWNDEFEGWHRYHASTKKSQSQPATFSDMVNKQRSKNLRKGYTEDEGETEWRDNLQTSYGILSPKIKDTANKLVFTLEEVCSYQTVGDFNGAEEHIIEDCIATMRELLDSLESVINGNDDW